MWAGHFRALLRSARARQNGTNHPANPGATEFRESVVRDAGRETAVPPVTTSARRRGGPRHAVLDNGRWPHLGESPLPSVTLSYGHRRRCGASAKAATDRPLA